MIGFDKIDLHTHTNFSDGELSPAELFDRAHENGVATISITDHDTLAPYHDPATAQAAREADIELIPGVEISTVDEVGRRFHVLGYYVDTTHSSLNGWLDTRAASRKQYAESVAAKIISDGWNLDVSNFMGRAVISKAHIAQAVVKDPINNPRLVKEFGRLPSRGQFIEATMNQGGKFYTSRESEPRPSEAVNQVHAAGGVAILAHPVSCLYEQDVSMDDLADTIVAGEFDGIEAIYYYFSKSWEDRKVNRVKQFVSFAERLNVLVTGGSDFHGDTPAVGRFTDLGMPGEIIVPSEKNLYDLVNKANTYRNGSQSVSA